MFITKDDRMFISLQVPAPTHNRSSERKLAQDSRATRPCKSWKAAWQGHIRGDQDHKNLKIREAHREPWFQEGLQAPPVKRDPSCSFPLREALGTGAW